MNNSPILIELQIIELLIFFYKNVFQEYEKRERGIMGKQV